MKNPLREKAEAHKEIVKLEQESAHTLYGNDLREIMIWAETEKDFNSAITKITPQINEKYPELVKYINEIPTAISNEQTSKITSHDSKVNTNTIRLS